MHRKKSIFIAMFLLAICVQAFPEKTPPQTTITCQGELNMDYEKNMAIFHKDVVVDDPRMKMTANEMTVYFESGTKTIQKVLAKGNVRFRKEEKSAKSEEAIYTEKDGKVVLTGHPMVKKGEDVITGDKITFYRDDSRMLVEPSAKLILYSTDQKSAQDQGWL
ncbi:MAG: hypothetical protein HYS08_06730 [Chlamydiae bacterium]|nr:hypothetical protein [Chlamydiota bacterium]MBI3267060.1 hypothetical protein [Chlamydiota bacterium]